LLKLIVLKAIVAITFFAGQKDQMAFGATPQLPFHHNCVLVLV
jgi:hypothetical protein